ncbi:MAG: hypothetical protein ACI9PX_000646 [Reinekea sp.]|jgi:uncharacterized protein (DUF3820 family)
MNLEPESLIELANTTMPFGKYAGRRLIQLPEAYLLWFANQGFPDNRLGKLMALALLIRTEGLEALLTPLTKPLLPKSDLIQ